MPTDLRERLTDGPALLADGATGTQLQARGLPPGACSEAWCLEQPEAVAAVAAAYAEAGSDLVYTNSFGGNPWRLERHGLGDKLAEVNRRAAELARRGAGGRAFVVGSMGPTGEFLEPLGELTAAQVEAAYAAQAEALLEGGAQGLVCETFAAVDELAAAVRGARSVTDQVIIASLTYGTGGRTMMGATPEQAVAALSAAGADVIGLNCGDDLSIVPTVVAAYRAAGELPILAKPNAGMPEMRGDTPFWPVGPSAFAEEARSWLAAGARILGGCCGTTPEYIAALARLRG